MRKTGSKKAVSPALGAVEPPSIKKKTSKVKNAEALFRSNAISGEVLRAELPRLNTKSPPKKPSRVLSKVKLKPLELSRDDLEVDDSDLDEDLDDAPVLDESEETNVPEAVDLSSDAEWEDADEEVESQLPALSPKKGALAPLRKKPSTSRAVSVSDPLRRFIDEVRKFPLLDPEEELQLALRLQNTGDVDAARRLVQANLRLVVKIAFEYKSVYANVMDLIQEGNLGLMKAVSKYDTTKGARLGYYASWWIRSYILKYLLDNFRLVKVGTTQAQKKLFFHLMREKERLEAQGTIPTPKLIADRLNVKEKEVLEMEQRLSSSGGEVSLDISVPTSSGDRTRSLSDSLPTIEASVEDRLIQSEWLGLLEEKLPQFEETLNAKEQKLLWERLLAEAPKTLQEVADLYGLTRERARQIEVKVIEKLRGFLKGHLDEEPDGK